MAGSWSSTTRRRMAFAASLAAAALFLAACGGQGESPEPTGTTVGAGQLGGAPTTSASPATPPVTTAPTNGGGGNGAPTFPKAAKDYALAFTQAYSAKNYDRVNQLAEQAVAQQVRDEVSTGGAPNSQWSVYSCSSVQPDGTIGCTLRNAHGDDIRVTMRNTQLGFPTAVTMTLLERTEYPSTAEDYLSSLLAAKGNDNKQRVTRLSNSTVLNKLTCNLASTYITSEPIDGTYVKAVVQETPTSPVAYEFKVLKSPGGKANAVKEVLKVGC